MVDSTSYNNNSNKMSGWQKFQILTTAISLFLIPIVVAVMGNRYTEAIKEREIQGKYIEIAVNILNKAPEKEHHGLRMWAVQIINLYSTIKLNESAQKDLIEQIAIYGHSIKVHVKVLDESGKQVQGARCNVWGIKNGAKTVVIFSGLTNSNGDTYGGTPAFSQYNTLRAEVKKEGYEDYSVDVKTESPVTIIGVIMKKRHPIP